jgi:diacylglycerol kinase family enzyme
VLAAQPAPPRGGIQLALDGEVIEERGPLAYRVRPGALRVFTPA